jgi:hypothetical protein
MRNVLSVTVALFLLAGFPATAAVKQPVSKCPKKLADCPNDGCSTGHAVDGGLNERKNITDDDDEAHGLAEPMTSRAIKDLPDPQDFAMGDSREELQGIGEGKKIRVFGFLLTAKPEGAESCNCGIDDEKLKNKDKGVNTDNHLVLVSWTTVQKFPMPANVSTKEWKRITRDREEESITAEFTPRVRRAHPNFTRAAVRPLILKARQMALPVRVTGLLMFDSQHFIEHPLVRVNNWEIHPILKLEFCPKGATCRADSDDNWETLDDL